jgi:hypothetical protein
MDIILTDCYRQTDRQSDRHKDRDTDRQTKNGWIDDEWKDRGTDIDYLTEGRMGG